MNWGLRCVINTELRTGEVLGVPSNYNLNSETEVGDQVGELLDHCKMTAGKADENWKLMRSCHR